MICSKAKAAGEFIGSGLGAEPKFAKLFIECGVQSMQASNDLEYMRRSCEQTLSDIRGDWSRHVVIDSDGQKC